MLDQWLRTLFLRMKNWWGRLKAFQIKKSLVATVGLYFFIALAANLGVLAIFLISLRQMDTERREDYVSQAALSIQRDLESLEKMSQMIYDESRLYFERRPTFSSIESSDSELNMIMDQIFAANDDIPGLAIYRPNGGMLAYTNPYTPYYFSSGAKSMYAELIKNKDKGSVFLRNDLDNQEQSMLAARFYKPLDSEKEYAIIVMEKNWSGQQELFSRLGMLDHGTIIMTNSQGRIIMSFRSSTAFGDADIVRNGGLNGKLEGERGVIHIEEYGEKKAVFYNSTLGYGCTLLYVIGEEYLYASLQKVDWMLFGAMCFLLLVNLLVLYLFRRHIYQPISNIESTLNAIVNGDTDLTIHPIEKDDELYPLYSNLNLLVYRLKKLIDSEYTASVRKKQAEIDALQSQINPHFLYNTLESIRGQAIEEHMESIEKMVKALADIFRYSITNKNAMVTLDEELKNIDNYLNIQQYRFNNKFIIVKEIDPETRRCLVPKLIVQPLVENAIVHGLETKEGRGTLTIRARALEKSLIINVQDDGEGIDADKLAYITDCLANGISVKDQQGMRIGLALININERVRMIFDDSYGLRLYSMKHKGTNAELWIPKTTK